MLEQVKTMWATRHEWIVRLGAAETTEPTGEALLSLLHNLAAHGLVEEVPGARLGRDPEPDERLFWLYDGYQVRGRTRWERSRRRRRMSRLVRQQHGGRDG